MALCAAQPAQDDSCASQDTERKRKDETESPNSRWTDGVGVRVGRRALLPVARTELLPRSRPKNVSPMAAPFCAICPPENMLAATRRARPGRRTNKGGGRPGALRVAVARRQAFQLPARGNQPSVQGPSSVARTNSQMLYLAKPNSTTTKSKSFV